MGNQKVTLFASNAGIERGKGEGKIHGRVINEIYHIARGGISRPSVLVPLRHTTLLQLLCIYISTAIC
jgi:hypothetical protein